MIYQISYDLKNPDKDYTSLYQYLSKEAGKDSIHVLRDLWWIYEPEITPISEFCAALRSHMDEKDIFVVTEKNSGEGTIDGWLPSQVWKWYKEKSVER